MRGIHWLIFAAVVIAVVIVGLLFLAFIPGFGWGRGYYGWRGGMMGGWCPWCGGPGALTPVWMITGLVMQVLMLLIPLGFIALLVLGVIWLMRSTGVSLGLETLRCPNCGSRIQPDWKACPYCGERLGGE